MSQRNVSNIMNGCFGCTACASICPTRAIEMEKSQEGFLYPKVKEEKCISCGKCRMVCPSVIQDESSNTRRSYKICAYVNPDETVLSNSTSGGFFSAAIDSFSPDYVCGAIFDKDHIVVHVISNQKDTIDKMHGSKYVQSNLGQCFIDIKEKLDKGFRVLFSGTSCQVKGLIGYLNTTNTNMDNLLTLDLVCHGVPSPLLFSDYLKNYEMKTGKKIINYSSRSKKYGWGSNLGVLNYLQTISRSDSKIDNTSFDANLWQNIFFNDYCIRECCYICPFATPDKPSDLTMGDFWGVESIITDIPFSRGCSLIICHSEKGNNVLNGINVTWLDNNQMVEAVKKQARLKKPITRPSNREIFWQDYHNKSFSDIAKKYFRYSNRNGFLMKIYMMLVNFGLIKLANRISKKIFL